MNNKRLLWISVVSAFSAGAAVASVISWSVAVAPGVADREEIHLGQSGFINPLVDCAAHPKGKSPKINELYENVEQLIKDARNDGKVSEASVYFRDLNNGPTFEIEADRQFTAASLLKVPVLIAYMREVADNPGLMAETVTYDPLKHEVPAVTQNIQPPPKPAAGKSVRIDKLLSKMIVDSDNTAAVMLLAHRPKLDVVRVLDDMGVRLLRNGDQTGITVKGYASIFRILYNSTYLGHKASNASLQLMSNVRFRDGLPAEIPNDILVAHKFGERMVGKDLQFHDCGIVYYPKRPYLLCVMSRGDDFKELVGLVADISKAVFESVK